MEKQRKNTRRNKGITLIALVITIIILLILAGISIAQLTGNGLINKAKDASERTKRENAVEKVELMLAGHLIENETGTKTLEDYLNEQMTKGKLDEVTNNGDGTITVEVDGWEITVNENDLSIINVEKAGGVRPKFEVKTTKMDGSAIDPDGDEDLTEIVITINITNETEFGGNYTIEVKDSKENSITKETNVISGVEGQASYKINKSGTYTIAVTGTKDGKSKTTTKTERITLETYKPEKLTIGVETPTNTDKYGWKVKKYDVKTEEFTTGVWRLYYQDTKYTYLIADEPVGDYKLIDYYDNEENKEKYKDGTKMSIEGQKLNGRVSSIFKSGDTKDWGSVRATVFLTDVNYWSSYANGDAIFCFGSPTAELIENSYNKNSNPTHDQFSEKKFNVTQWTNGTTSKAYADNAGRSTFMKEDSHGIYATSDEFGYGYWLGSPRDETGMMAVGDWGCFSMLKNAVDTDSAPVRPLVCMLTTTFNNEGYGEIGVSLVDE